MCINVIKISFERRSYLIREENENLVSSIDDLLNRRRNYFDKLFNVDEQRLKIEYDLIHSIEFQFQESSYSNILVFARKLKYWMYWL
jgi:hypothetical protein